MGLSPSTAAELLEAFRTGEGVDLIRESVRMVMQELIEAGPLMIAELDGQDALICGCPGRGRAGVSTGQRGQRGGASMWK